METRDAIQGHVPRTHGGDYGEHPPDVMLAEIQKLPRYQVIASASVDRCYRANRQKQDEMA